MQERISMSIIVARKEIDAKVYRYTLCGCGEFSLFYG
jgi:hypothetical protein